MSRCMTDIRLEKRCPIEFLSDNVIYVICHITMYLVHFYGRIFEICQTVDSHHEHYYFSGSTHFYILTEKSCHNA